MKGIIYLLTVAALVLVIGFSFVWLSGHLLHYDIVFWGTLINGRPVQIDIDICYAAGWALTQFTAPVAILTFLYSSIH